ncbi:N-acetyltransferase [Rouxiella badensis]|jgi:putative acetyltransferase|uniref:GNAT family N-acetyltransferase n=1 Tax=Rouxiella badensis TaxID=1646377 RepID=UPI001D14B022|nr:N-acetyltransferase [Rouxiella badensis]MCC3704921.1 N-acetyltransferase [Rouxiella badensis]MCC3719579.1 N-acetyltransferase [Rouxiella badensis]MCC3728829.1 N-acetyltransferase [Rouxiella badensis]MCC3733254.1 N-acetyltransferase [Rouxiella badensis]MCC3740975.1 N-acetyltransferase [Rouxiella badensis]
MLIRVEIPVDAAGIDNLLRKAFGRDDEADLVQRLREDGLLTLGVVATDDEGGVVGYAAFTPVDVQGEDRQWVGLGPLAVEESLRRQGLGEKLVYEGLDSLNEFGYAAVVVLGAPEYYGRFGFKPAAQFNLHCRWPDSAEAFQLYVLADNALEGANGLVEYPPHFNHN